ncbi:MAG TPA: adenylate/guanylate cyclase domain-containing protein, partial [Candidatus Limnocylindria bacterium]
MPEERRLVTVLFADAVGSTSLGESMDPEDLRLLLGRFYEVTRTVVEARSGTLEKFIGDAALAIFGLPHAHDDDAARAIDAALELRDLLRRDSLLRERLPIRIGINTGEVVASLEPARDDFIVTGDAVNVAARLQQSAEPWQILASARTASAAIGRGFAFGPRLELGLKGKADTVAACPVVARAPSRRPQPPIVGRDADLAQLELVATRAFVERRPYMVTLIAAAGTGKSRVVEEFLARLATGARPPRVAVAQCLPYGQSLTYWPMRALLLGLLDLHDEAPPEEVRDRCRSWLAEIGSEEPEATAELLAATIGASDADVLDRSALFAAWRRALELAALRQPLVLLIEDLHWSSDSLLDLIEFVLQPTADAPMLMLALTRPELLERRPTWGGGRRNHVSLALGPLDATSIAHLVESILDGPAPELVPILVERSEGNPFYAGEMVRSLLERGVDLHDPVAVRALAATLPDTVQATVLARLDALEPPARRLLQVGSVFGRSFTLDGAAALDPGIAAQAAPLVERLVDREMVRAAAQGELVFRHILIRDVAYGTLPRVDRARFHAAAGEWLEATSAGREDEQAELIAFHYREAAVLGSVLHDRADDAGRARAVAWLRRAADVVAAARGTTEAAAHLRAAIELAPPAERPPFYRRLGELYGSGDVAIQAYATAWRLGADEGLPADFLLDNLGRQLTVVLRWFASAARQPSLDELEGLIQRGRQWLPDAGPRARATFLIALGFLPFWLSNSGTRQPTEHDLGEAAASVAAGLAIAEELDDAPLQSAALDAQTSRTQTLDPVEARELSRRRVAMAQRLPMDERLDALNMVAWTSALIGDLAEADDAAATSMALVQPGQNPGFALGGASWRAYVQALIGNWEALATSAEELRNRWLVSERPAASYALQGFLSAVDWARNRRD